MQFTLLSRLYPKPFRLRVDRGMISYHQSYSDALATIPSDYETRWTIDRRVGERWFNQGFGYRGGTTSTIDLARAGVPIGSQSLSTELL